MGAGKSYSIIIVPTDHSGTRQYRVSRRLLGVAGILLVLSVLTLTFFVATYTRVLLQARKVEQLEADNAQLRGQVALVGKLSQELEELSGMRAQVMAMLGAGADDDNQGSLQESEGSREINLATLDLEGLQHLVADEARRGFAPRQWPVDGQVTREFFHRSEETADEHPGLDIAAPENSPIRAAGSGRVVSVGYDDDMGNYVILDHGFGFRTLYGHNARVAVEKGQVVDRGQVIAYLGSTGSSKIPHLHFEIRVDGQAVDPRGYLTRR